MIAHRSTALLLLLSATPLVAFLPRSQDPEPEGVVEEEEPPLVVEMKLIKDGLKRLRSDLSDATKLHEDLGMVVDMQASAKACKTMVPPFLEQQPEAEQPAFLLGYRKEMIRVEEELLRLETAILDGDLEAAKASYKVLKQMEEDGHAIYTEDG